MQKPLLVFDYDGVIVDSIDAILDIAKKVYTKFNLPRLLTRKDLEEMENVTFEDIVKAFIGKGTDINSIKRYIVEQLLAKVSQFKLFTGMDRILKMLSEKYTIVIISSNLKEVVKRFLEKYNLQKYVSMIIGAEIHEPKSQKILMAASLTNTKRADITYIGDTVSDIREAKQVGVKSVAVTWGFQKEQKLAQEHPDKIIHSVDEAVQYFAL